MARVDIYQVKDATFVAKGDTNHWIVMDDRRDFDGCEAATEPMEMLLASLGGCTAMWLHALLKRDGWRVSDIKVGIDARRDPGDSGQFREIALTYRITGSGLNEDRVKAVVREMETTHSAVYGMLSRCVPLRSSVAVSG